MSVALRLEVSQDPSLQSKLKEWAVTVGLWETFLGGAYPLKFISCPSHGQSCSGPCVWAASCLWGQERTWGRGRIGRWEEEASGIRCLSL